MRRFRFAINQFYHVFNRGVEKRKVFVDSGDHARFVHGLYEFNDKNAALNFYRTLNVRSRTSHIEVPYIGTRNIAVKARDKLVDIIAWCLMPNHFHLLLRQAQENGVSLFMQKVGTGFTNFFNLKYERSGVLFQGKYKAVPINTDVQLKHVIRYNHLNPVDLIEPGWKEHGIEDWKKVNQFLENEYRWSSYWDYLGKKNFPSVLNMDLIRDLHGNLDGHRAFVQDWMAKDLGKIQDLLLE